ncbi:uncharacterized protein LOC117008720 isoform X7 [Catharus ustulatus]|uniref:uncharacterized protein LOC117008720 isoform X7 n=1 Tax=Catharus ustulatus TaxID=91951 RepID=UPI00140ADD88|nr:uncharacterized protein LOC117008720 isoform X7 [Catharus ustulatus]
MRGHLHECAVTLGALGALGALGTLGDPTHGQPHLCPPHCSHGCPTFTVPVANATITPGPPALQVTPLLEVTPQGTTGHRWNTVAAALGGSLLFLLLLVAGAVGWHRWNSMAARKQQESVPPCHHTPGSPGDLRGAGSDPWATAGMRGHLHECAVTLGALGALGTLGTPPMGTTLVVPPLLPWVPNIHG